MPSVAFDIAGPGLIVGLGLGLGLGVLWYLGVIVIEAVMLTLMRWARFWRALLAAFLMNTLTTIVGFFVMGGFVLTSSAFFLWFAAAFVASVALEWGVLALMDRPKAGPALRMALVVNVITYLPMLLLALWLLR